MKVQETGFVEFVTDLITGTVDAVISSQLDQEKKTIELRRDLLLTREEFSKKYNLLEKAKEVLGKTTKETDIKEYVDDYIASYKETLKEYFNKNALKVIVDRGKVNAKLIFSFTDDVDNEEENKPKNTKPNPRINIKTFEKHKKINLLNAKMNRVVLKDKNLFNRDKLAIGKKMIVKPIDGSNKDMLDLKTDIISNVEFSFRTVIE